MSSSEVLVKLEHKTSFKSEHSAKIRFLMINTEMTAVLAEIRLEH